MRSLGEIAQLVGGTATREPGLELDGVNGIEDAGPRELTFVVSPRYARKLRTTRAGAVITTAEVAADCPLPAVVVDNPNYAFLKAADAFRIPEPKPAPGVHATAVVAPTARIGEGVTVGPLCVIEDAVEIGAGSVLVAQVYVGRGARIGRDALLQPRSVLHARCELGERVILQAGAVVGSDGFGYATVEGVHHKIPQHGIAVVEDDVEIGANSTVDRARVGRTVVGRGAKLDNLVQIGHNVVVGPGCLLCAQVGIAGSTELGKYVVLAGQAGVGGHLRVADGVMAAGQSGVSQSYAPGARVSGTPARSHADNLRRQAALARLPELLKQFRDLEARVGRIEERTGSRGR